jgi:multimeric flavodoxin WrbA
LWQLKNLWQVHGNFRLPAVDRAQLEGDLETVPRAFAATVTRHGFHPAQCAKIPRRKRINFQIARGEVNSNQSGRSESESLASKKYCMNSIAILGSARKNSNTAVVLQRLIYDSTCDVVDLQTCSVAPYNYENNYPSHDQFLSVIQRIIPAPVTIIATPVYWYSYSTPMKIFIDRFSDLLGPNPELGRQLRGKRFALVSSGSKPQPDQTLVDAFSRFCNYLGIVFVGCAHAQDAGEFSDPKMADKIKRILEEARIAH